MDRHTQDLIFDLAAGNLPEAEARAAEASLGAEGRAELAAQRAVLAAIADAPPVAMTDFERAYLHRSVAGAVADTTREMSPVAVAAPAPGVPRARSVRWMRWASAAAVAAMFVGVVAVGSQLGSLTPAGDSDTSDTLAATNADMSSSTSAPAIAAAPNGSVAGGFAAESDGAPLDASNQAWMLPVAPPLAQAREKSDLDSVAGWLVETGRRTSLEDVEDITSLPCYAVASEDDDLEIVEAFTLTYPGPDGEPAPGIGYADAGTDVAEPVIRIYDLETCESVLSTTD